MSISARFFRLFRSPALKFYTRPAVSRLIAREFHKVYYYSRNTWLNNTYWFDTKVMKCPFDLWVYQELLHELKPDWIIECGTAQAGSALYFASLCELMGHGRIVTIDIKKLEARNTPPHPRITYLAGSTVDPKIVAQVQTIITGSKTVLVVLDSDHSTPHVLDELRIYHGLVTPGSYLVVEDTNIGGHPVGNPRKNGPMEAVARFLGETDAFEADRSREKFMVSFNTGGWLRKVHD